MTWLYAFFICCWYSLTDVKEIIKIYKRKSGIFWLSCVCSIWNWVIWMNLNGKVGRCIWWKRERERERECVFVYLCVFVCARMCVSACAHQFVSEHLCMHACIHICLLCKFPACTWGQLLWSWLKMVMCMTCHIDSSLWALCQFIYCPPWLENSSLLAVYQ